MRVLFSCFAILGFLFSNSALSSNLGDGLKHLPVQDGGRIKPFDTFAREILEIVHGKESYKKRPATDIVFTWMLVPEHWQKDQDLVAVKHNGLRTVLKLDQKRTYYSIEELLGNEKLAFVIQELKSLRERQEKLNPYYQSVQTLENQLTMFQAIVIGKALRILPPASEAEANALTGIPSAWIAMSDLAPEAKTQFEPIIEAFKAGATQTNSPQYNQAEAEAKVKSAVTGFVQWAAKRADANQSMAYADLTKVKAEVFLNDFHPFRWAWVSYLLAAILIVMTLVSGKVKYYNWSWIGVILGFSLHTFGFGLRSYLAGRPPVSNMYETVVWVAWGCIVFAMIFEWKWKIKLAMLGATLVSILCLILSDLAPSVLDNSLHPLEPVLRSQFWLTTHVLIITISYAAFFLAFVVGDILLFYFLKGEEHYKEQIRAGVQTMYRSIQIGVVLLAAGIILGGIWADYSWGRFWGWDPKETWALIALLGYLAILHGRLIGWLRDFGLATASIVAFSLIIMAWYGVNFVLGAGLHTYGFGAGGVEWVSGFVAIHFIYVTFAIAFRSARKNTK